MADIPTWTLTLSPAETDLVLRGLLAVLPGMAGGDGREFFRTAVKSLQIGSGAITGHSVDLISVVDSVQTYFDTEAATRRNRETTADASAAYKLVDKVRQLIAKKPTGKMHVPDRKPVAEPVKAGKPSKVAAGTRSLFGDDN